MSRTGGTISARWFYLEGTERQGPFDLKELRAALLSAPTPGKVFVWRHGMRDWQRAEAIPEVCWLLLPASSSAIPFDDIEAVARRYRWLVLLIGIQILLNVLYPVAAALVRSTRESLAGPLIVLALSVVMLALLVTVMITVYRLAGNLGLGLPMLWSIAMFPPCINLIVLLILSAKAQAWCAQFGIKVGLLGPTKESIEEVRQLAVGTTFD